MDLPHNTFQAALGAGKPQIGFWCGLGSNLATEIVAGAGFDWVVIDMEHTINDVASVLSQLQAVAASGPASPVVRMPSCDPVLLKRLLDVGVNNILVPFVEEPEQAAMMIAGTRYPPAGNRGMYTGSRGGRFGRISGYVNRAHEEICIVAQIETTRGLDRMEEIADVEGLGAIFVGPNDLAAALGHVGDLGSADVKSAVFDAALRLKRKRLPAGCTTFGNQSYADCVEAGFSFVSVGTDVGVLARSTDALVKSR